MLPWFNKIKLCIMVIIVWIIKCLPRFCLGCSDGKPGGLWTFHVPCNLIACKAEISCQMWCFQQQGQAVFLGWRLLNPRSLIVSVSKITILQKYIFDSLSHMHIWQVSPQLSCGDTCQIGTWYSIPSMFFGNATKFGKMMEWWKLA